MKQQHAAAADTFAPFQQALTQGWSKALESFQSLGMSGTSGQGPSFEMPRFSLSTEKLQELQQQYISTSGLPSGDYTFCVLNEELRFHKVN